MAMTTDCDCDCCYCVLKVFMPADMQILQSVEEGLLMVIDFFFHIHTSAFNENSYIIHPIKG